MAQQEKREMIRAIDFMIYPRSAIFSRPQVKSKDGAKDSETTSKLCNKMICASLAAGPRHVERKINDKSAQRRQVSDAFLQHQLRHLTK
jgi:hypothetical protein